MIHWYQNNISRPPRYGYYLISNGYEVGFGTYKDKQWWPDDMSPVADSDCTHWASINLPQAIVSNEPHSSEATEAEGELN